ncbi:TPA: helix-turn-helix transcriptional regulator [Staphylococcus aureus]|uniref:XRE family transcriptional regulator n=4 Tax=Staphylococcus aureus TaxID=1280 RepID=UPI000806DEB1|nr:XRE family transcriptional regulator [Staphylococcus aureus]AXU08994.1 Xre family transcriptional regulator [Staphylococcus aureus]MBZ5337332.1 helix-turn-helix transcriptional regulator [Staphylococcus aureus]MBZ5365020.1 helix-turn-helix transcriptional regulator [Staphylococcus aureus]MCE5102338.1 helix-turn-helix transcriptional regulator [Staphylococcus aureus]MCE5107936.1 helix-turn-helix transcriptional regulator [Staphylococcus aureus]
MGIGEGLKKLRKNKNMTMEQLATDLNNKYPDLMKLTKGKISKWENEKEEPRLSTAKILAEYFNVKINDLYSESNTTYKDDNDITSIYNKLTPPRQENVLNYANSQLDEQNSKGDNVVDINSYKQDKTPVNVNGCVSAGVGERLHDETLFTEMVKAPVPPHDLALKVNGDSMEPMFKDGEIIFVEKTHNIKNGQIGIFIIEEEAYVKKVFVEDDRLTLVSLNKEYRDLHFYRNESVRLVGKVIL